jgi:hypothetical protein
MPNIAALKMQNPLAIPAFLALSTEKSPTRFHEDPISLTSVRKAEVDLPMPIEVVANLYNLTPAQTRILLAIVTMAAVAEQGRRIPA